MTNNSCKTKYDCGAGQSCLAFCTTNGVPDYTQPCLRNSDCPSNSCLSFCQGNNCGEFTCTSSEICATNLSRATTTVCIPKTCQSNVDCSSSTTAFACINNTCSDMSCGPNSDNLSNITLADEYLCVKNKTIDGLLIPQVCASNADCRNTLTGYTCQNGLCINDPPTACNCSSSQTCCKIGSDPNIWAYGCCDKPAECCQGVNGNMCCVGDSSCVYDNQYHNGVCCGANQVASCPNGGDSPCTCVDCESGTIPSTAGGIYPAGPTLCCPTGKVATCPMKGYIGPCICCNQGQTVVCDSQNNCNCQ